MAGAIVGTEARLGDGVIVNCAAVVDHHCRVGDFGHLGVNAAMAGGWGAWALGPGCKPHRRWGMVLRLRTGVYCCPGRSGPMTDPHRSGWSRQSVRNLPINLPIGQRKSVGVESLTPLLVVVPTCQMVLFIS